MMGWFQFEGTLLHLEVWYETILNVILFVIMLQTTKYVISGWLKSPKFIVASLQLISTTKGAQRKFNMPFYCHLAVIMSNQPVPKTQRPWR